jgi:hypothetical protein
MLRLAIALVAAVAGVAWLNRASRDADSVETTPAARNARYLLLALCGVWTVVWVVLAAVRIRHPFELEWIGGSERDYVVRLNAGQPIYDSPSVDWIPSGPYPPIYFWISADLHRYTGLSAFASLRLVSILSTLGVASLLFAWVRRVGGSRDWAFAALGIFFAAYRITGAWYDVERVDMLALFLALAAAWWTERAQSSMGRARFGLAAAAGAAFVLAFLTKQQGLFFFLGAAAALVLKREWKLAGTLAGVGVILTAATVWALNASSNGWFGYYCFSLPLRSGIDLALARNFLLLDLPLFAPCLILAIWALKRLRAEDSPLLLMGSVTGFALFSTLLSRAHWGGDQNVLIPGFTMLTAFGCASAAALEKASMGLRLPLTALAIAQILVLAYRPDAQLPTAANREAGARFAAIVAQLEREGEVLVLDHGGFTRKPRCHFFGLMNVTNAEHELPASVKEAFRTRRFAAIVLDESPPTTGPLAEMTKFYPRSTCLELTSTWVVTGYLTPSPDRRVWVLRP